MSSTGRETHELFEVIRDRVVVDLAGLHIIWRCRQDNTPYDPNKHHALQRVFNQAATQGYSCRSTPRSRLAYCGWRAACANASDHAPITRSRCSATTSIRPTTFALNSPSSSAGIQYSRLVRPPLDRSHVYPGRTCGPRTSSRYYVDSHFVWMPWFFLLGI